MTLDATTALPRWVDPRWRGEAVAWATRYLTDLGVTVTGRVEQPRATPWSTQLVLPTDHGRFWFKANAVGVSHEASLLETLHRLCPTHVLPPVAVDRQRGWLLLPDGGRTVRDLEGAATDLGLWERMLVEYAELQRVLAPHVEELLATGTPDGRPHRLPAIRAALLDDDDVLMIGHPDGLTEHQRDVLRAGAPAYAELCTELDSLGIPASLQHDDLHDNNVFLPPTPGGPLRIFDWGDAVVGHPFGTLLVALRVVAHRAGLAYGARELLRLRDAYLEPWTAEHGRAALENACRLALRVGGVLRADCYRRALLEATPQGRAAFGDGVPQWLLEFEMPTPVEP